MKSYIFFRRLRKYARISLIIEKYCPPVNEVIVITIAPAQAKRFQVVAYKVADRTHCRFYTCFDSCGNIL